jgi:hypothetical protein
MEVVFSYGLLSIFLVGDILDVDSHNIKNNVIGGLEDFK